MTHEAYMAIALDLAQAARSAGEVPVGCIIIDRKGKIIGRGQNRRETEGQATAHAEIRAIEEACRTLGDWRLGACSIYVTLEPCPMCAGAIINARIGKVFYGAQDPSIGACGSVLNLFMERFGHSPQLVGGILKTQCAALMVDFFRDLRGE